MKVIFCRLKYVQNSKLIYCDLSHFILVLVVWYVLLTFVRLNDSNNPHNSILANGISSQVNILHTRKAAKYSIIHELRIPTPLFYRD